jgi:hypothetical protein
MKSKGLGDTVAKITKITGIKKIVEKINKGPCVSCGNRQEGWNLKFPHNRH